MKTIIIEGPDNSGKNTIINRLLEGNVICEVIHCSKPVGVSNEEKFKNQTITFNRYARHCIRYDSLLLNVDDFLCRPNVIVFNRAWYGEYVYGQMYRDGDPDKIKNMISYIEDDLNKNNVDVYYIQLMSSSVNLLHRNDDGLSLSNADKGKIQKECDLFKEIFEHSKLKKKLIYINNGDEFRTREEIADEAMNFINNN